MTGLKVFLISQNQLSGPLPSWLQTNPLTNNRSLVLFDAACNRFDNPLPDWCVSNGACEPCPPNKGNDNEDLKYLWFLVIPGVMMLGLFVTVCVVLGYRYKMRSGFDVIGDGKKQAQYSEL